MSTKIISALNLEDVERLLQSLQKEILNNNLQRIQKVLPKNPKMKDIRPGNSKLRMFQMSKVGFESSSADNSNRNSSLIKERSGGQAPRSSVQGALDSVHLRYLEKRDSLSGDSDGERQNPSNNASSSSPRNTSNEHPLLSASGADINFVRVQSSIVHVT